MQLGNAQYYFARTSTSGEFMHIVRVDTQHALCGRDAKKGWIDAHEQAPAADYMETCFQCLNYAERMLTDELVAHKAYDQPNVNHEEPW